MTSNPIPAPTISTPRLKLIRLTDTSEGSQDVQWVHENRSDPVAMAWSLNGATKTLSESRAWMKAHLTQYDIWFYAVFLLPPSPTHTQHTHTQTHAEVPVRAPQHIGSISLRHSPTGPTLPPPQTFSAAPAVGSGAPLSDEETRARQAVWEEVELNMRVLGYALFEKYHGKGYVTEASRALLDAYSSSIARWKSEVEGKDAETVFYVEAGVDVENPGSQAVLRKLGFRTVGMKVEKEKVWLNGGWRGPGWWITGLYLQS